MRARTRRGSKDVFVRVLRASRGISVVLWALKSSKSLTHYTKSITFWCLTLGPTERIHRKSVDVQMPCGRGLIVVTALGTNIQANEERHDSKLFELVAALDIP